MELTHLDLFSGIGGFALAARWAGIKTIQFVELDKFCCKVLNKNFPGVPIHNDIKTFRYNETSAQPFLLTGGFPCQPFSCAGKQRGTEDNRYLWPEMLRVISETKPQWIIGENVRGFISNGNGMVFENCCLDLEREGYAVQAFIIPACAVNAPHRRDRVWIVANSRCEQREQRCPRKSKWTSNNIGRSIIKDSHATDTDSIGSGKNSMQGELRASLLEQSPNVCWLSYTPENGEGQEGNRWGNDGSHPNNKRLQGAVSEGIQGSPREPIGYWDEPWLKVATRLCRVDDGVSKELHKFESADRVARLKALGNAIVPQVAFQIMRGILNAEMQ